jgi:hypothetical protein
MKFSKKLHKFLNGLCLAAFLLLQPLFLLHLRQHLAAEQGQGTVSGKVWAASDPLPAEECPICRMAPGLAKVLPLGFLVLLLLSLALGRPGLRFNVLPPSGPARVFRLRGPPRPA